jgi:hypothetical protein
MSTRWGAVLVAVVGLGSPTAAVGQETQTSSLTVDGGHGVVNYLWARRSQ